MRAVIQLVKQASVTVEDETCGQIDTGLLVLLGVGKNDTDKDAALLVDKVLNLRIFADETGLMNRSLLDAGGDLLVVSQFTLFGDCRKGRRPSYSTAAPPDEARRLYEVFINQAEQRGVRVATGEFQAMMEVSLTNNGPVTLLIDTEKLF